MMQMQFEMTATLASFTMILIGSGIGSVAVPHVTREGRCSYVLCLVYRPATSILSP